MTKVKLIRILDKRAGNLWDVDSIRTHIKRCAWKNKRKNLASYAYRDWCRWKGFDYDIKLFREETSPLPYIPSERMLDQLIASANPVYAAFLQLLKESAFRPSEAQTLTLSDVDIETKVLTLNKPSKYSNPRQLKISDKLASMITRISIGNNHSDLIWSTSYDSMSRTYANIRSRLALKLNNPNIEKITFKTFRHWKATMEYHRTKDLLHVKQLLGHKSIKNTLVYTHLVDFEENDNYIVKVASTIDEFTNLLENGFEYVSDYQDKKILRKRK